MPASHGSDVSRRRTACRTTRRDRGNPLTHFADAMRARACAFASGCAPLRWRARGRPSGRPVTAPSWGVPRTAGAGLTRTGKAGAAPKRSMRFPPCPLPLRDPRPPKCMEGPASRPGPPGSTRARSPVGSGHLSSTPKSSATVSSSDVTSPTPSSFTPIARIIGVPVASVLFDRVTARSAGPATVIEYDHVT